ncbi:MAG: hypothetical protein K6A92_06980 [Lachnospiraceae bacterium]|nr:hypothetical protein [Lachnospiraceae bacterium]
MNFELWLFAIKHLGQTPDASKNIFNNMPEEEKKELEQEYASSEYAE